MRYFCTYFDSNYLTRGLALHHSLVAHSDAFELTVLCMDEEVETVLREKSLPGVRLLAVAELISCFPSLATAKGDRTRLEFYFTCTAWLMRHLLPKIPPGELLTYLDADLYFFASPKKIYEEIGPASVAITPHRFPPALSHLERYGKFNVGWVSLRHDATGKACAMDWGDKCAAWCFNVLEADRYADQKYLDSWEAQFPGTVSLANLGVNVAPWNIKDCSIASTQTGLLIEKQPLIFYHFHALVHLGRQLFDPSLHKYDTLLTSELREFIYLPYLRQLLSHSNAPTEAPDLVPPARVDDPRSGLAVPHLLALLQASELDRAQRLSAIETNMSATQQTIEYLKKVENDRDLARASLEQTVAFLKDVEKDSADRLTSIQFHQDKLKTAYADLERNVAYLKRLEAEIAAHIKVGADKDAIIADLAEKLRLATERPAAGS